MEAKKILNAMLVDLFNHILYIEEQNLISQGINLTMNEVHTIEAIDKVEQPTMGNVARLLMITDGTLTTNVKRLEDKGYIKRVRDKKDGRVVIASLTPKAYDVLKMHESFHNSMIDKVLNDLSDDEERILLSSLIKIEDYFKFTHKT